ncbi:hypothetical protein [Clostridium senegalense]|uniref:hypothetical protein n=1 Tax=Clostridium senegalense TaxID=1465809 RepID=UPI0002897041|nr:hypothetical protein [Clostridium senegalense]
MDKLQLVHFQLHVLLSTMFVAIYIICMVMDKDELEQEAQSYALKGSNISIIVLIMAYIYYKATVGSINLNLHVVMIFINILCVLYLILYFLYMKGMRIQLKVKNIKILNGICYLSTAASIIFIITGFLKVKIFTNESSLIRLDTLLMMINFITISLIIGLYPKKN